MIVGVYPGTFDPITIGHLDIIKRSLQVCDKLYIAIGVNPLKKTLFSVEERIKQINSAVSKLQIPGSLTIQVCHFEGLIVEFARSMHANILIRGIRSVSDFEYELTLANANKLLAPEIDTFFLPTSPHLAVVSSSAVKEIAKYNGPIHNFVTSEVENDVRAKFSK